MTGMNGKHTAGISGGCGTSNCGTIRESGSCFKPSCSNALKQKIFVFV